MKKLLLLIVFVATPVLCIAQTPCQNGFAGIYPCNDYDLMSHISLGQMSASSGNDSWGWTDSQTGNEYALMGLNNGTAFIDISDPVNPIYLGKLPTATSNSSWRDVKVYNDHAFIVSEASNHGMQVFDLTRLRNVASPPQTFNADALYNGFGSAHNIVINEDTGYAYGVGTNTYNGGPHFVNIQDPVNPVAAGGYSMDGYSHDAQVITYNGPDPDYAGSEILIGSNENEVVIVDITNKSTPVRISAINYSNVGYTHQGWFTENQRYFILGDELDESNVGFNSRTIVFDFLDLNSPQQHMIYSGPTAAIDHNGYVKGNTFYLANYRAGIRVIDIAAIGSQSMSEVGFFDTYPSSNSAAFNGVWNVYPYFDSGNIVISDIEGGLFLVRKSGTGICNATQPTGLEASNIGSNAATISWDPVPNATFKIKYRIVGAGAPWTIVSSNTNSTIITGLSADSFYKVRIRSKCADNSKSKFSGLLKFNTLPEGNGSVCDVTISDFPFTESFESTFGHFTQDANDDLDWEIGANATPSSNTGPSNASDGSTYTFVEASGDGVGYPNKRAILNSPCFNLTAATNPSFNFDYHMYGATDMGSINLEASTDSGATWNSIWSQTGNQGNQWISESIDLSAYSGTIVQLRINRLVGGTWQADIAIDNIVVLSEDSLNQATTEDTGNLAVSVSVYPNPVHGASLSVKLVKVNPTDYVIYNLIGQVIKRNTFNQTINVSSIQKGVYMIKFNSPEGIFIERFIKE